jgi:hypothetical protein
MLRTYPIGTTAPRRPESLRDIVRRIERELAADPERVARRRTMVAMTRRGAF